MSAPPALTLVPDPRPELDPFTGSFLLRRDALALGLTDRALSARVKRGDLVRFRHGAYADAGTYAALNARDQHALRARAVLRQAQTGLVLSHISALVEHGGPEWGLDLTEVHATRVDKRAGRVEAGVHQHQSQLLAEDVVTARGVSVTSPTRTAIDATKVLPQVAALCQLNHLLHHGLTELEWLDRRYAAMSHDPGTLGTGLLLGLADGRLENVAETRTFHLMWRHDVPLPVPQYVVMDARSQVVARLDFAWPDRRRWLEFDGLAKYRKPHRPGDDAADVVIREKQREDLVRRITGWRCLRITWKDLENPEATARMIMAFLAGA